MIRYIIGKVKENSGHFESYESLYFRRRRRKGKRSPKGRKGETMKKKRGIPPEISENFSGPRECLRVAPLGSVTRSK